jgi:hypothetical protein
MNFNKMTNYVFDRSDMKNTLVKEELNTYKKIKTEINNIVNIPYLSLLPKFIYQMILEDFCSGKEFVNLSMVSKEFQTVICQNKNYVDYTWKYYCFIFFE